MKRVFRYFFLLSLTLVFVTSCEDENKNPLLAQVPAPFVFLELDSPVIDVTDIENSTYGGTLIAPSNNVVSYEAQVRRVSGGVSTQYAPVFSTTSFPVEFQISAVDVATALGIDVDDLLPGDQFDFVATSVGEDGTVVTFNNLGPDMQVESGQRQAYQLTTFISCPFVQSDAIGTYDVVSDPGGFVLPGPTTFDVYAGEDSGQIVMDNPFNSSENYQVPIDVTPFGIASVEDGTFIFTTLEQCCAGFEPTYADATSGFVFSCSGAISLTFDTLLEQTGTGALFTFGAFSFGAQKQ